MHDPSQDGRAALKAARRIRQSAFPVSPRAKHTESLSCICFQPAGCLSPASVPYQRSLLDTVLFGPTHLLAVGELDWSGLFYSQSTQGAQVVL
jgi:hypothetical protein